MGIVLSCILFYWNPITTLWIESDWWDAIQDQGRYGWQNRGPWVKCWTARHLWWRRAAGRIKEKEATKGKLMCVYDKIGFFLTSSIGGTIDGSCTRRTVLQSTMIACLSWAMQPWTRSTLIRWLETHCMIPWPPNLAQQHRKMKRAFQGWGRLWPEDDRWWFARGLYKWRFNMQLLLNFVWLGIQVSAQTLVLN